MSLDDITIIRHGFGRLLVADGGFVKCAPHCKVYEGCGRRSKLPALARKDAAHVS